MAEGDDPVETAAAAEEESDEANARTETGDDREEAVRESPETDPFAAVEETPEREKSDERNEPSASEDPFEAALQIAQSEHDVSTADETEEESEHALDLSFLLDIKLNITFEVGRAKMFISDLLSLGQGSVIELHRLVGEELELFINGRLFATGEVVVVNEKFGAKISKIVTPEERIQRLGAIG